MNRRLFIKRPIPASLFLFFFFSQSDNKYYVIFSYTNCQSIDFVLGIQTHGRMMVAAHGSTVL